MNASEWFKNSVQSSIDRGWLTTTELKSEPLSASASASDTEKVPSKRYLAVLNVWGKLDKFVPDLFDSMPLVTFIAPPNNHAGHVRHVVTPLLGVVVYLAPSLESYDQRYVNHVAAHELAHVFLGHYKPDNPQIKDYPSEHEWMKDRNKHTNHPAEKAVNELAAKWGFPKCQWGQDVLGRPSKEQEDQYRSIVREYVNNILPTEGGMVPSPGIGGTRAKMRVFCEWYVGKPAQATTANEWTEFLTFLANFREHYGAKELVKYINNSIETKGCFAE